MVNKYLTLQANALCNAYKAQPTTLEKAWSVVPAEAVMFQILLEFANDAVSCAPSDLAEQLCQTITTEFLQKVVGPALLQQYDDQKSICHFINHYLQI